MVSLPCFVLGGLILIGEFIGYWISMIQIYAQAFSVKSEQETAKNMKEAQEVWDRFAAYGGWSILIIALAFFMCSVGL